MGLAKGNSKSVKVDEIDVKILKMLTANARENQKVIAEKCGITPVAVLRRIQKMKENGVIIGTYLILSNRVLDEPCEATVLIDVCNTLERDAKENIRQVENVLVCAESIGRFNLCAFIVTHGLDELNETIHKIRNIQGVNNVSVNIWTSNRHRNFERDLTVAEN